VIYIKMLFGLMGTKKAERKTRKRESGRASKCRYFEVLRGNKEDIRYIRVEGLNSGKPLEMVYPRKQRVRYSRKEGLHSFASETGTLEGVEVSEEIYSNWLSDRVAVFRKRVEYDGTRQGDCRRLERYKGLIRGLGGSRRDYVEDDCRKIRNRLLLSALEKLASESANSLEFEEKIRNYQAISRICIFKKYGFDRVYKALNNREAIRRVIERRRHKP